MITETRLEDGRYNIWLVGCRRARIVRELPPTRAFRLAEVELLDDVYTDSDSADSMSVPPELVEAFRRLVPDTAAGRKQVEQLLAVDIRLGTFADIVAFSADLDLSLKQQLLAECNVARRVAMLLENLAHAAPTRADSERHASGSYPIKFSDN